MATTISPDVADVLARSTVEGTLLRLPAGRLDVKLYGATDKVLKMLGGKWDRRQGGHVFAADPAAKLAEALGNGSVVSHQQTTQQFFTPPDLAERLASRVVNPGDHVLEPSAGAGSLVRAALLLGAGHVSAVELDADLLPGLAEVIGAHNGGLWHADFLEWQPAAHAPIDVVLMNPPFRGNQDIRHVLRAYSMLAEGGRLAAIVSEHGFIGKERECAEWREWLDHHGAEIEVVPAGAFKASGTGVQTRMIVVRRSV